MSGQGDTALADETALWQSLSGVRARFSAGGKYANPTRGETRVMISGSVFALMLMLASSAGASNSLPMPFILFCVAGVAWMFG